MKKAIVIVPILLIFFGYAQSDVPKINPGLVSKLSMGVSKPEDVKGVFWQAKRNDHYPGF